MTRYIDADAMKPDYIVGSTSTNTECYRYVSLKQIVNAPTADVVERKKGKWENICSLQNWQYTYEHYRCSNCGIPAECAFRYCPNCGAEMRERRDDE